MTTNDNCLFCQITNQKETTELVFQDEEIAAFKDIRPAAKYHYLICPRRHIDNAKSLTTQDISLVERLVDVGKSILQKEEADMSKIRMGFHWPPFCTIHHLHLHVISPCDEITLFYRLLCAFKENTFWFRTADRIIEDLRNLSS